MSVLPEIILKEETSLTGGSTGYDGVLLITCPGQKLEAASFVEKILTEAISLDSVLANEVGVFPIANFGRLVHSPTGKIDSDYQDVRILRKAAIRGMQRALKIGIKFPLVILEEECGGFEESQFVILMGILEALHVPIQSREQNPLKHSIINKIGVYSKNLKVNLKYASILERGRRIACDIGDGDPERMSPPRVQQYVEQIFENTEIKMEVIKDLERITKEYPLFESVNRAASGVERHQGRIIFMEYNPPKPAKKTIMLVGKGVTYDTGGIDVKINGAMVGMSRDKCGAAAAIGFMEIVRLVQPEDIKVVVGVGLVRNSIGSNGYVADELLTARSGVTVRVVNTDAEGRMIMADILCRMKEIALQAINPHLFTIATLTGHAFLSVGEGFSIVMDNGVAHLAKNSQNLQASGDLIGDMFEVSRIRPEDYDMHRGDFFDDVKQGNNQPSSRTPRGHQAPAAFLILASGLDQHGIGSKQPLKYSHLDIAASAGEYPKLSTGSPVLALAWQYLLEK